MKHKNMLTIIALICLVVSVGCKGNQGKSQSISDDTRKSQTDAQNLVSYYNLYGTWHNVYTVEMFQGHDMHWGYEEASILIRSDDSVVKLDYEVAYDGAIIKTEGYDIHVHYHTMSGEGEEYGWDEDGIITYNPTTNRLKIGDKEYRKEAEHEIRTIIYNYWVDDRVLYSPLVIFYTPIENDGIRLDEAVFIYDGREHTVNLRGTVEPLHFYNVNVYDFFEVKVDDFNHDTYFDLVIRNNIRSTDSQEYHDIFMYDPKAKRYSYDGIFP